eukprot:9502551-Pyramimonas_sp.AAC.1
MSAALHPPKHVLGTFLLCVQVQVHAYLFPWGEICQEASPPFFSTIMRRATIWRGQKERVKRVETLVAMWVEAVNVRTGAANMSTTSRGCGTKHPSGRCYHRHVTRQGSMLRGTQVLGRNRGCRKHADAQIVRCGDGEGVPPGP